MTQATEWARQPPRLPLAVSVGVTGHRPAPDESDGADALAARLGAVLDEIAAATRALGERERELFADEPPVLRFVSPLAEGADLVGALEAAKRGYAVQAILPFAREDYAADFRDAARDAFDSALTAATCVLELPGDRANEGVAYAAAGRATVAHSDILIAVWDGEPARGRGGTGEVVEHALRRGLPVVHIPVERSGEASARIKVLWQGLHSHAPGLLSVLEAPGAPFGEELVRQIVTSLLAPPASDDERACIRRYYAEPVPSRERFEYPALLWLAGAGPSRQPAPDGARPVKPAGSAPTGLLSATYDWSDRLATHYARTYRSGHVANFGLAALAVLLALSGLLLPKTLFGAPASAFKIGLVVLELLTVTTLVWHTRLAGRRRWHGRWLDYRHLAEQLRPMRSLNASGAAAPPTFVGGVAGGHTRWVDWYAAGVWRQLGCPAGRFSASGLADFTRAIIDRELSPQIAHHTETAERMAHVDHRLHRIGTALFGTTILVGIVLLAALIHDRVLHGSIAKWPGFTVLAAGLPAVGGALFGIRTQIDFAGAARRSRATAKRLKSIIDGFDSASRGVSETADLFEQTAQAMLADVADWRTTYRDRALVIPN